MSASAVDAGSSCPGTRTGDDSRRTMALMGVMMGGAGTVDALTATMIPITARHFTDDAGLIAVLVALNRVCGFVVQPYVAWKSDRYVSHRGRRRPFLLVAWPVTLFAVGALGVLPMIVPEEIQHTVFLLGLLFLVNLALQATLDACYGAADPLYGDTFAARELGRAQGARVIASNAIVFSMTAFFVPLADIHEFYPYLGSMFFLGVSTLIAMFFLSERVPSVLPKPERYHPLKPLRELANPHTRHVALVASAVLVTLGVTEMLHALFVTETLGFSKTVLGLSTAASLVIGVIFSYPLGVLVDRWGGRRVLVVGFAAMMLVELGFVFWVDDLVSLSITLILFKIAWLVVHIPVVPLMFQGTPEEHRGSVFAAVQMTRAGATSAAVIAAGFLVDYVGSYRMCYLVGAAVCLIGLYGALRLRPDKVGKGIVV
ncbi:MAG TPA: MFS transporter [Opitutaceae bacterium]|nr:MFS transporter [Opitutaceae bacterium]